MNSNTTITKDKLKFYIDQHICAIETGQLPWYVKLFFWLKWAPHFDCSTLELRDVKLKSRFGHRTLVVTTSNQKVPIYMGVSKTEAKRITGLIQERCASNTRFKTAQ